MTQQHRPLTGMVNAATGIAAPLAVPVAPANPVVIHQIDATNNPTNFLDEVTLVVQNNDAGAQSVSVIVSGGPAIVRTIPANSVSTIFFEQPFFGQAGQPANCTITVQALAGAGMVAWGFFTRN